MKKKVIRRVSIISLILFSLILVVISLNYKKIIRKGDTAKINGLEESEIEEKIKDDNWAISTVFYDSAVDDGKTPLTEIDWDASDGGYGTGDERKITVQINYKNTTAKYDYLPGEVTINISNMIYNLASHSMFVHKVDVSANVTSGTTNGYPTVSGMDWDFSCVNEQDNKKTTYTNPNQGSITEKIENYTFKNAIELNKNTNFEGTIQIIYTLQPIGESLTDYGTVFHYKSYQNECEQKVNTVVQSSIGTNKSIKGNNMQFNYYRKYTHQWKKRAFNIKEKAEKLESYDGLGENASDYIWVKYIINDDCYNKTSYPYIGVSDRADRQCFSIPENCKAYGIDGYTNDLVNLENNDWSHKQKFYNVKNEESHTLTLYIGYPKNKYNNEEKSMIVTNPVKLYGIYDSESEEELLATTDISIDLSEYEISYSGNLYEIRKYASGSTSYRYDEQFKEKWEETFPFNDSIKAIYTGDPLTVKYGDDFLYATNQDGVIERLSDSDYYFRQIIIRKLKNANGQNIDPLKYETKLYVRYAGDKEYTLYGTYKDMMDNPEKYNFTRYNDSGLEGNITFSSKNVVAYYFEIIDAQESIIIDNVISNYIIFNINSFNISKNGRVGNFNFLQVYKKDESGNKVIQNSKQDNYSVDAKKLDIAEYDLEMYGEYAQRGQAEYPYNEWKVDQHLNPRRISIPEL